MKKRQRNEISVWRRGESWRRQPGKAIKTRGEYGGNGGVSGNNRRRKRLRRLAGGESAAHGGGNNQWRNVAKPSMAGSQPGWQLKAGFINHGSQRWQ
jgi:hypothetical protein